MGYLTCKIPSLTLGGVVFLVTTSVELFWTSVAGAPDVEGVVG